MGIDTVTDTRVVPTDIVDAINSMRAPIVMAHVVPDADALGSMFAVALAWRRDDCVPKVSLPEGSLSQRLSFLFDWARVPVATEADFIAADGFVVLDTAKKGRCNVGKALKDTDWSGDRPIVNIDHHAGNTGFGNFNWVVGSAGSACELAYELIRAGDRPLCPITASLLFAGIQTDTLGFSLPTTSAATLRAAADLVASGANVAELGERLCRSQRKSEFDLLRRVYANTKIVAHGEVSYSSASYDDIHDAGCTFADIDDQINVPRSLEGVRLAMLFTEGRRGKTRINFRSSGNVTVLALAGKFNGGGHNQAAGAILDCGLQEAIDTVLPQAIEHLAAFG